MTVLSFRLRSLLLIILCIVAVLVAMPIIAGAQSVVDPPDDRVRDSRGDLLFFSMKPVVIGEGTQTVRISSKRWHLNSTVTLDASSECTDEYGITFETQLPVEFEVTERYHAGINRTAGRTDYPLLITPGTVATGISEMNSECKIILSDGEYTAIRPLRQIAPEDKKILTPEFAPSLMPLGDIGWDHLGHTPGVWFSPEASSVVSVSRYRIAGSSGYGLDVRYVYNRHGHPESVYAGSVPPEWIEEKLHFCISVAYSVIKTGYNSHYSPEKCYNGEGQPTPIPLPTRRDLLPVMVFDSWCNRVERGVVWPDFERKDDEYITTLKYECSASGYKVKSVNGSEWMWDDPAVPNGLNGTVYNAPLDGGYVSTPTPTNTPASTGMPTATPTPTATPIEDKPEENPTATPTATSTATPTPTPTAAPIEDKPEEKPTATPTATSTATPTPTLIRVPRKDPNDPEMKCPHRNDGIAWNEDCSNFPKPPYRWWWE